MRTELLLLRRRLHLHRDRFRTPAAIEKTNIPASNANPVFLMDILLLLFVLWQQ
jgi:hypothetical protein